MIDKRVYSLICSRWIDSHVLGCRPWSDLVAAKKHLKKIAVLKGIKQRENTGKFVTKLVEKLTFASCKSDKFTCAAEREDLPRPRYFVHIYMTKH